MASPAPQRTNTPGGSALPEPEPQPNASSTSVDVQPHDSDPDPYQRHLSKPPTNVEVESQMVGRLPLDGPLGDPFGLQKAYKSEIELDEIRANTSRKRHVRQGQQQQSQQPPHPSGTPGPAGNTANDTPVASVADRRDSKTQGFAKILPGFTRSKIQARRVQSFYQTQNETIERLLKTVEEHRAEARQEHSDDKIWLRIAIWGSLAANVILSILQLYAAITSTSLSLFTTMADSIFDPLSNVTLIVTDRAVRRVDPARFPSGKARLETVGNIVFCFLMTAVSFILIAFSARELSEHTHQENFHLPSVIAVSVAFGIKFLLFLLTWSLKNKYSQVMILWKDHRNDLLINGFGILTSVGGAKLAWWLDPAGAIVLSVIVSSLWLHTAFTEFLLLVGVAASVEMQQLITYVCVTHAPAIRQIDTVRVYHSGPRLIAEVDVVMDPYASLMDTHDVAEDLQFKLESLPDVERAYVHVDYETTHKPEHAYKKDL